jgi:hypothetical protein
VRPHATLQAIAWGSGGLACRTGELPLPSTEGVYPFIELESAAATEHVIVTACTAAPVGGVHGALRIEREDGIVRVRGEHGGQMVSLGVRLLAASARLEP